MIGDNQMILISQTRQQADGRIERLLTPLVQATSPGLLSAINPNTQQNQSSDVRYSRNLPTKEHEPQL